MAKSLQSHFEDLFSDQIREQMNKEVNKRVQQSSKYTAAQKKQISANLTADERNKPKFSNEARVQEEARRRIEEQRLRQEQEFRAMQEDRNRQYQADLARRRQQETDQQLQDSQRRQYQYTYGTDTVLGQIGANTQNKQGVDSDAAQQAANTAVQDIRNGTDALSREVYGQPQPDTTPVQAAAFSVGQAASDTAKKRQQQNDRAALARNAALLEQLNAQLKTAEGEQRAELLRQIASVRSAGLQTAKNLGAIYNSATGRYELMSGQVIEPERDAADPQQSGGELTLTGMDVQFVSPREQQDAVYNRRKALEEERNALQAQLALSVGGHGDQQLENAIRLERENPQLSGLAMDVAKRQQAGYARLGAINAELAQLPEEQVKDTALNRMAKSTEQIGAAALGAVQDLGNAASGGFYSVLADAFRLAGAQGQADVLDEQAEYSYNQDLFGADRWKRSIAERYNWEQNGVDKVSTMLNEGAGYMLPSIAGGALAQGASAVGGLGQVSGLFSATSNSGNAGLAIMAGQVYGQSTQEALDEGATIDQAQVYGALSAITSVATEKLADGIPMLQNGGIADDFVKKVIKNPKLRRAAGIVVDLLGEGAEEAIESALEPVWQRMTYNPDANWTSPEEIAESFGSGVLLSALLMGGNYVDVGGKAADRTLGVVSDGQYRKIMKQIQPNHDTYTRLVNAGFSDSQIAETAVYAAVQRGELDIETADAMLKEVRAEAAKNAPQTAQERAQTADATTDTDEENAAQRAAESNSGIAGELDPVQTPLEPKAYEARMIQAAQDAEISEVLQSDQRSAEASSNVSADLHSDPMQDVVSREQYQTELARAVRGGDFSVDEAGSWLDSYDQRDGIELNADEYDAAVGQLERRAIQKMNAAEQEPDYTIFRKYQDEWFRWEDQLSDEQKARLSAGFAVLRNADLSDAAIRAWEQRMDQAQSAEEFSHVLDDLVSVSEQNPDADVPSMAADLRRRGVRTSENIRRVEDALDKARNAREVREAFRQADLMDVQQLREMEREQRERNRIQNALSEIQPIGDLLKSRVDSGYIGEQAAQEMSAVYRSYERQLGKPECRSGIASRLSDFEVHYELNQSDRAQEERLVDISDQIYKWEREQFRMRESMPELTDTTDGKISEKQELLNSSIRSRNPQILVDAADNAEQFRKLLELYDIGRALEEVRKPLTRYNALRLDAMHWQARKDTLMMNPDNVPYNSYSGTAKMNISTPQRVVRKLYTNCDDSMILSFFDQLQEGNIDGFNSSDYHFVSHTDLSRAECDYIRAVLKGDAGALERATGKVDTAHVAMLDEQYIPKLGNAARAYQEISGNRVWEYYFNNVSRAEAEEKRALEDYQKRIGEFKLNKVESQLVHMMLDGNADAASALMEQKKGKYSSEKVDSAVKEFRAIFEESITNVNLSLVRSGYETSGKIDVYAPHFFSDKTGGINGFLRKIGIDPDIMELPSDLAGVTKDFRPGKVFSKNLMRRTGTATDYNILEAFDQYLPRMLEVIYRTEAIQRLRVLETDLREQYASDSFKEEKSRIDSNPELDAFSRQQQLIDLYLKQGQGETHMYRKENVGPLVTWLLEYTNHAAGKLATLDRGWEDLGGRKLLRATGGSTSKIYANMATSISSIVTNVIPMFTSISQIELRYVPGALFETVHSKLHDDGFCTRSDFLYNRRGARRLDGSAFNKLGYAIGVVDQFSCEYVVRALYNQYRGKGYSENEAMWLAEKRAAGIVTDRSAGAAPMIFQARNPILRLVTAFQQEAVNTLAYLTQDIPEMGKQRKADTLNTAAERYDGGMEIIAHTSGMLIKFFVGAFLFNQLYEEFFGRRPEVDPFNLLIELFGDITDDDDEIDVGKYFKQILEWIPGVSMFTEGGRVPVASAMPSVSKLADTLTSDGSALDKAYNISKEVSKPLATLFTPAFGNQIRKTAFGVADVLRGGIYGGDNEGNRQLRAPIDTDDPKAVLQAIIAGTSANEDVREYYESWQKLTADQTRVYEAIRGGDLKLGVSAYEFGKLAQAYNGMKNDVDENGEEVKGTKMFSFRKQLAALDISDADKALLDVAIIGQRGSYTVDYGATSGKFGAEEGSELKRAAVYDSALSDAEQEAALSLASFASTDDWYKLKRLHDAGGLNFGAINKAYEATKDVKSQTQINVLTGNKHQTVEVLSAKQRKAEVIMGLEGLTAAEKASYAKGMLNAEYDFTDETSLYKTMLLSKTQQEMFDDPDAYDPNVISPKDLFRAVLEMDVNVQSYKQANGYYNGPSTIEGRFYTYRGICRTMLDGMDEFTDEQKAMIDTVIYGSTFGRKFEYVQSDTITYDAFNKAWQVMYSRGTDGKSLYKGKEAVIQGIMKEAGLSRADAEKIRAIQYKSLDELENGGTGGSGYRRYGRRRRYSRRGRSGGSGGSSGSSGGSGSGLGGRKFGGVLKGNSYKLGSFLKDYSYRGLLDLDF